MNTCSLPTTGGFAGTTLALVFLALGIGLVLLVRRSPARLSVLALVPLVATAGLGMSAPTTECASPPTTPPIVGDTTTSTTIESTVSSTPSESSLEIPTTERFADDLTETTTAWVEPTLPPAPTASTTWPTSPTTSPSSTAPGTPGPVTTPPVGTTTTTIRPGGTTTTTTTVRPTTTTVRPPMTWAPYTTIRELESDS